MINLHKPKLCSSNRGFVCLDILLDTYTYYNHYKLGYMLKPRVKEYIRKSFSYLEYYRLTGKFLIKDFHDEYDLNHLFNKYLDQRDEYTFYNDYKLSFNNTKITYWKGDHYSIINNFQCYCLTLEEIAYDKILS